MLSKQELLKIKECLPKGGLSKISSITGRCPRYVSMVLSGVRQNVHIINTAIILIEEKKQMYARISKKIKSI